MASHLKDFYLLSHEYLRLLSSKRFNQADTDILDAFYEACKAVIEAGDRDIHSANLAAIAEHAKAIILEQELKTTYNELYKRYPLTAAELIAHSAMPTKKELEQSVHIR